MTEWREYKLSEIMETSKKQFKPDNNSQLNYIGLEHIEQGSLRLSGVGASSSVESNKFFFNKGDVLFGKLRPYFRKVIYAPFDGICSTDIWVCKAKSCCDQKFLFYFLSNQDFIDTANTDEGSRMPRASWDYLKDTLWILPPLPEQKAIAEVLSSLDDKIDILTRQNKTLEDLAQTYFRKWFVEDASEDWETKTLQDYFPVVTGKKDANYATDDGNYPFFTCAKGILFSPTFSFEGSAIILAGNGDFNVKRYTGKFEAYQRTYVLIPYNKKYFNWLYLLISMNLDKLTLGFRGSVINYLTKDMITDYEFQIPPYDISEQLSIIDSLFKKIDSNNIQIQTLQKLRDTLLPKLINGEVRVKQ